MLRHCHTQRDGRREKTQREMEKTVKKKVKMMNHHTAIDRISVFLQPRHNPQIKQSTAVQLRSCLHTTHLLWHTNEVGLACGKKRRSFPPCISLYIVLVWLSLKATRSGQASMGRFLMHTLSVTTQQSDALSREMSPLIFICLELI